MSWTIRYADNDTIVWCGETAGVVDAEANAWQVPDLVFETPWYHCATCLAGDVSRFKTRLTVGAKFCAECGTKLDWEHMEAQAAWDAKVAAEQARVSASARPQAANPVEGV